MVSHQVLYNAAYVTHQVVPEKLHDEGGVLVALFREGIQLYAIVSLLTHVCKYP